MMTGETGCGASGAAPAEDDPRAAASLHLEDGSYARVLGPAGSRFRARAYRAGHRSRVAGDVHLRAQDLDRLTSDIPEVVCDPGPVDARMQCRDSPDIERLIGLRVPTEDGEDLIAVRH